MHVRNPMMFSYEYPEHTRNSWGHAKPEAKAEALEYAFQNRWKHLHKAWMKLEEKNLEAQVEWGAEYQTAIQPLRRCRVELQLAIEDRIDAAKPNAKSPTAATKERDEKSVIYYVGDASPHDSFTREINAAIYQFETRLRPKIGES